MIAGLTVGSELQRFRRNRFARATLVVLTILPLIYGSLYIWAYWDPFGQTGHMPVAVVNEDTGAINARDGGKVEAGDQVVQGLLHDKQMGWHEVSPAEGYAGLAAGKYYFMVVIPPNFSKAVASPSGNHPEQAQIQAVFSDPNNFIATSIGRTAIASLENAVSTRVSREAVGQVLVNLQTAGDGIIKAADGAHRLADGTKQLTSGTSQLAGGSALLATNLHTAQQGSAQLAAGAQQLSTGINKNFEPVSQFALKLSQAGTGTIDIQAGANAAAAKLLAAAQQMEAANHTQANAATDLVPIVNQLLANPDPKVRSLGNQLQITQSQLASHQVPKDIANRIRELGDQSGVIHYNINDLQPGPLKDALESVTRGGAEVHSKLQQLIGGAAQLSDGANRLHNGLTLLADGGDRLHSGANQLNDGAQRLNAGAQELSTKLAQGAKQVPHWTSQQRTDLANTIGGPVRTDSIHEYPVKNFGNGVAPFFITLALFFGGTVIWMVLRALQSRAVISGMAPFRVMLASFLPALPIALMQAIVLYLVCHFAIGVDIRYPVATVAFMCLIAIAFTAFTQMLSALFGPQLGRVVTLALLMLQLVAAGGLYPVETTSTPFQWIHPYDPMTYGVNGLRQLMGGGIDHRLTVATVVLIGLAAGSMIVTSVAARSKRQWNELRFAPPTEPVA